jgi:hypothetical protein
MTYDSQFTPTGREGKGFLSPAHKFIYKLMISIMGLCITVDSGRKITRFLFLVFYIVIILRICLFFVLKLFKNNNFLIFLLQIIFL